MELIDIIFDIRVASAIVAILFPFVAYWYATRNHDYWEKKGIPFIKPIPVFGTRELKKNLEDKHLEGFKKFGRIYGYYEGNKPAIVVAEPELVKNILVKDFQYFQTRRVFDSGDPILDNMLTFIKGGEDWKRIRTIVSPTFSTGKIKRVRSIFEDCAKILVTNIKDAMERNSSIDVIKFYGAFTMDVIASSAFSTKLDSHKDPENEFVLNGKDAFTFKFNLKFILIMLLPKFVLKFFRFSVFGKNAMEFFKKVALEIIKKRKETGETRNDFLQLLIDSENEVSNAENKEIIDEKAEDIVANYGDDSSNHPVFKSISNKHLTKDELVAQCVIFFLAGYHTTATTLSLVTYNMALNEDVQDKVFQEMKDILEENSGELTYEAVQKMKYLDDVISETMRLHAPAMWLDRTAEADYELGDTGITIPKGMPVQIPVFALHRDPKYFPEPEKFNPERFSQEERNKQIPYSFIPFGAGPRNCVAMRFALLELKVCLVHVLCTYKAKRCSKTKVPLEFGQGLVLIQPKEIELVMEPRSNNPLKS